MKNKAQDKSLRFILLDDDRGYNTALIRSANFSRSVFL